MYCQRWTYSNDGCVAIYAIINTLSHPILTLSLSNLQICRDLDLHYGAKIALLLLPVSDCYNLPPVPSTKPNRPPPCILLNEHVAEDGPTVFAHACRLGAEGIVSKRVDGLYRSGPCPVWIEIRNPASISVQRERSENWNG